jgi:hypothetical protein
MSTLIGVAGTQSILAAQRIVDMADKIYLLEPNAAPLYVLVSKLNKRVAINTTFSWLEDVLNPSWVSLGACAATDATALTAAYNYINAYDVLKVVETGELLFATATITTTAVTVVRSWGDTAAAPIETTYNLLILGPAFEEGETNAHLLTKSSASVQKTNYLQIFRKSVEITKTLANSELYGGNDRNYQRKKKGIEFLRDLERSFIHGEDIEDTSSTVTTHARRTTAGLNHFISTNSTTSVATMTESEFETALRTVFRYGSNSRYLFCAPLVISVISQWAQGKLSMFPNDKTYGIAITQYLSPHGTLNLVKEVMLEHSTVASTSYYAGYCYFVELEDIVYRYLQNRDVQMETDIQLPGDDTYKDQYIAEVGMEFHNELKMGKMSGITG